MHEGVKILFVDTCEKVRQGILAANYVLAKIPLLWLNTKKSG